MLQSPGRRWIEHTYCRYSSYGQLAVDEDIYVAAAISYESNTCSIVLLQGQLWWVDLEVTICSCDLHAIYSIQVVYRSAWMSEIYAFFIACRDDALSGYRGRNLRDTFYKSHVRTINEHCPSRCVDCPRAFSSWFNNPLVYETVPIIVVEVLTLIDTNIIHGMEMHWIHELRRVIIVYIVNIDHRLRQCLQIWHGLNNVGGATRRGQALPD